MGRLAKVRSCSVILLCALILALALLSSCAGAGSQAGALPNSAGQASPPGNLTEALSQLDAMPCPKGVSAETWAELTDALREALASRAEGQGPGAKGKGKAGSELALMPPHGDAAASTLGYSAAGALLSWGYFSPGDYDQNGVVGLSDLVPLAVHFGESTGTGNPFPENSIGAVIDGDANGELNLADIIAIATNFGVHTEGYRVYSASDWNAAPPSPDSSNGTGAVYIGQAGFSLAVEPPGGGRKTFNYPVVPTYAEQYDWVRPTDGETDGSASNYVVVVLPPKRAPIAKLSYPLTAETLAYIVWNASTSYDPDGVISRYEWDFNDDGVYEYDSGNVPTADYYYYAPGDYTCTVRVTDNDFYTDTESGHVTVTEKATWHTSTVDELDLPTTSLEITTVKLLDTQGYPGIFYLRIGYDPFSQHAQYPTLVFCRALDAGGATWPAPTVLSTAPSSEWGASFMGAAAAVAGNPAVAFNETKYDEYGEVLERHFRFLRAEDAAGSSWPPGLTMEGGAIAITLLGDKPVLFGNSITQAQLAIGVDQVGSSFGDWITVVIPTPADFSLNLRGGLCEYRKPGEDIWYYRAQDLAGASWLPPVLVNPFERAASSSQLLELAGKPAVLFYDLDRRALKLRVAREVDGSSWMPSVEITPLCGGGFKGWAVNGRLAVFYRDRFDGETKFTWASDGEGTLWADPMLVPDASSMSFGDQYDYQRGESIAAVNGLPAVAHSSGTKLSYFAYY